MAQLLTDREVDVEKQHYVDDKQGGVLGKVVDVAEVDVNHFVIQFLLTAQWASWVWLIQTLVQRLYKPFIVFLQDDSDGVRDNALPVSPYPSHPCLTHRQTEQNVCKQTYPLIYLTSPIVHCTQYYCK